MFFGQTSNSALVRAAAKSNVNHEPFPTPHNTDVVSRTRDSVSSEVSSKNGPRSLIIRGTTANSASEMYSEKLDQIGSAQTHLGRGQNDELLNSLDRGDFEGNLGLVGLDHLYSSLEILPTNIRRQQFRKTAGQKETTALQKRIG